MSRNVEEFEKPEMWEEFKKRCGKVGVNVVPVSVDRDWKEQTAYFAQGRELLSKVNSLRKMAGLTPITAEENKIKITWTMNSEHVVNLEDEKKDNDKSRAIDFGIIKDGKYLKGNVAIEADLYKMCAKIAEAVGFYSMGMRKGKDWPHIQIVPFK